MKKLLASLVVASSLLFSSCEKKKDVKPEDSIMVEQFTNLQNQNRFLQIKNTGSARLYGIFTPSNQPQLIPGLAPGSAFLLSPQTGMLPAAMQSGPSMIFVDFRQSTNTVGGTISIVGQNVVLVFDMNDNNRLDSGDIALPNGQIPVTFR